MTLPIRIMTREFRLIDEVDRYESLQITRSWHGIGGIELRVNRHLKGADELKIGRIIFPHNQLHKACVIRHREIELDERGKITENWVVRALSLKSWFAQRATIPPQGVSQDAQNTNAESVMRHYVYTNVINPSDAGNRLDEIVATPNLMRGATIEWQSRYKELSNELEDISLLSGLGWNIDVDYKAEKYVFDVIEGRNLTAGQTEHPPAIFSPELGTLGQLSFTESELNYKNYAIVAGQGEGADRRIVTVGNAEATGFDRYVLFVDARDIEEETDADPPQPIPVAEIEQRLRNRGRQKLAEHNQEMFLEGQALMGRVSEKVPTEIEGKLPDATVDQAELDTVFITPYQPIEETSPIIKAMPSVRLTKLGRFDGGIFTWLADEPPGTRAVVEYSFDNERWVTLNNGGSIDVEKGDRVSGLIVYFRYVFSLNDHAVNMPAIRNLTYKLNGFTTRETISTARLLYGKDYDLGDLVTLRSREWGVSLDARLTEVKEIYEAGRPMTIELTFGNDRPTLVDVIKQEIDGLKTEMTR